MPRRQSFIEQATVFDTIPKPKGYDELPRIDKHYIRQDVKGVYDTMRSDGHNHEYAVYCAAERARKVTPYYARLNAEYERNRRCGAKTRKGTPCKCKPIPRKARCKFHGGMSTGPRTLEGRIRALSCLVQYKSHPKLLAARVEALTAEYSDF